MPNKAHIQELHQLCQIVVRASTTNPHSWTQPSLAKRNILWLLRFACRNSKCIRLASHHLADLGVGVGIW